MRHSLAVLVTAFALGSAHGFASDWPRFRGPNGSGVNETTGLPTEFGPDKNLVWKTALPPGHSSPILVGDRIFLTAYDGDKLLTFCLERATGKILWRRESPRDRFDAIDNRNSQASPTPVSDGKNVFVFFHGYGLVSYGIDGNERWRVPLGPFTNVYGMGVSPVLVDDEIVLIVDQSKNSYAAAYGQNDGKLRWKVARPEALSGASTPSVIHDKDGNSLIVAPASFRMDVYSAKTGEIAWFMHGLASEMKSVPIIDGETIYISGYNTPENDPGKQVAIPPFADVIQKYDANKDGKISKDEAPDQRTKALFKYIDLDGDGGMDENEWKMYAATMAAENSLMAINANAKGDVTGKAVKWKFQKSIPQLPSVVLYQGVLYMINDTGVLTTLNASTGEVYKQARLRGTSDRYYASPVAADGKVFIAGNSGVVAVLKAGGDQELLAANKLDEDIFATPAIADGRIYVRTVAGLYCFGGK
ncbi:MAG TPA: PQQ-binding-like beta-propeller repeat protein [Bryobacteraceae bacterium]|nr:PQQ-binding-like beta-propeller repeat protein [Bryobacteraceae bacterium]